MFVAFVMPCALGRPACLASPAYAGLTSQLVLARARGHFTLAGGKLRGRGPVVRAPLIRAGSPRNPRPPARGRSDSLVHLLIGKLICYLSALNTEIQNALPRQ